MSGSSSGNTRGFLILGFVIVVAFLGSLMFGARDIGPVTVIGSMLSHDVDSVDATVVREVRLPRTFLGLFVGAGLGVAGAVTQGITRNPLGDPAVLGINAGAACAVAISIALYDLTSVGQMLPFACVGAALAAVVVHSLAASTKADAAASNIVVAGAAVAALLIAITGTVTLLDRAALERYRFWVVGSLADRADAWSFAVAVPILIGLAVAFGMRRTLNVAAMGQETAASLGVSAAQINTRAFIVVVLTAATAVAAAGPIAFVGLIAPHAMRSWRGSDHYWLVPASSLAGAILLLSCDIVARMLIRPAEIKVGVITAAIGGPVLLSVARRSRAAAS